MLGSGAPAFGRRSSFCFYHCILVSYLCVMLHREFMEIKTVDLKNYSSIRIGGEGRLVVVVSVSELTEVMLYARREGLRIHILGDGTNTFFSETLEGVLFIKIAFRGILFEKENSDVIVTVQAGETWDDIVRISVEKGLWGIENLSLIPGTVGAAPVQNIGAYGVEISDAIISLSALDCDSLNVVEINKDACNFEYRDSLFKQNNGRYVILSLRLRLSTLARPVLTYKPLDSLLGRGAVLSSDVRDLVTVTRKSKLPDYMEFPNVGSFFKNPTVATDRKDILQEQYPDIPCIEVKDGYKIPAAWLIEHVAQMKGVRIGDVGTWPTQPLVLVNYGKATAHDVIDFSYSIIHKVQEKTGIILEREVNYVS